MSVYFYFYGDRQHCLWDSRPKAHSVTNGLTGESGSDWSMTGIPTPSSSDLQFLCEETQRHVLYRMLHHNVIRQSCAWNQRLTFRVELSGLHTCSSACLARSAARRCPSGLAAETCAAAHFPVRSNIAVSNIHVVGSTTTIASKMPRLWETADLSAQSAHLLLWPSQIGVLFVLKKNIFTPQTPISQWDLFHLKRMKTRH